MPSEWAYAQSRGWGEGSFRVDHLNLALEAGALGLPAAGLSVRDLVSDQPLEVGTGSAVSCKLAPGEVTVVRVSTGG